MEVGSRGITVLSSIILALLICTAAAAGHRSPSRIFATGIRTLDGSRNNLRHPDRGKAGTQYVRVAPPRYADGVAAMVGGPEPRYVSNRIFNDLGQNIFSERDISQWGWVWAQFLDHTFGLRQTEGERAPLRFDAADPLEDFSDPVGTIDFTRTPAAPGTGLTSPREQINTVSSYIDAWSVYGGSPQRLDWLREGPRDGDPLDNGARLLLSSDGYLPRADARGQASDAPQMELVGALQGQPAAAVVAGDVRANENIALTAVHTLFAREHNRIVDALPSGLSAELKFQIARRIVGAELQYITYTQFLPALGVQLRRYRGYDPRVDAGLSNEFAVVGYRGHSMIHGTIDVKAAAGTYTPEQLDALEQAGVEVEDSDAGGDLKLEVPLNVAFGNPGLVRQLNLGPILAGLASERQYRNDEQIDNQLRSVLFQAPGSGAGDPGECVDHPETAGCFSSVLDLGAVDIERGRDHGIPSYNDLRAAYGLPRQRTFTAVTGEPTDRFPADGSVDVADPLDDRHILDFTQLLDRNGNAVEPGSGEAAEDVVTAVRRSTLAARLESIYGNVDRMDAFVGMMAEPHVRGSEFGELQLAIWRRQFEALRDGDRFFYLNDPALSVIRRRFGIDYRHTLSEIIELNTDLGAADIQADVFRVPKLIISKTNLSH